MPLAQQRVQPRIGPHHCAGYPVTVKAKAILGGAYVAGPDLMRDNLRSLAAFPTSEPYTALGFTNVSVSGTIPSGVLGVSGNNAIVDWVLVELRDASSNAVLKRRAALIQRDGDIVDVDGVTPVRFFDMARTNYKLAVRHRNHLGVMTAASSIYGFDETVTDFTDNSTPVSVYTTPGITYTPYMTEDGKRMLWSGNVRLDTRLKYTGSQNDRDPILVAIGGTVPTATTNNYYGQADLTMDGLVMYTGEGNDRDPILANIVVKAGLLITSSLLEQLP
jgi:hypothetical protein